MGSGGAGSREGCLSRLARPGPMGRQRHGMLSASQFAGSPGNSASALGRGTEVAGRVSSAAEQFVFSLILFLWIPTRGS